MSTHRDPGLLRHLEALDADRTDALEQSAELDCATRVEPSGQVRQRLLGSIDAGGRLAHHAPSVAQLLDITPQTARRLLEGIDRPASWKAPILTGVSVYHVSGGPRVRNTIAGFVKVPAGGCFPEHGHLGDETILVIQGSLQDSADQRVYRPGEIATMAPDTTHTVFARPGPDLIYLAVVFEGIRIGDRIRRASDPEL